jgi:hypothetical protein
VIEGISSLSTAEHFDRKLEKFTSTTTLLSTIGTSNTEAAVSADGTSSSRLVDTAVLFIKPCPTVLASPFVHTLTPSPPMLLPAKPIVMSSKKTKFSADFLSTRIYNCAACYGEALNVLQDNSRIPHHQKREMLFEQLEQLREDALTWCCRWGGVAYWHISLHETYTIACEDSEEDRNNEWEIELLENATNRRRLLFQLTSMVELLAEEGPSESHRLKKLLRISMEMMQMVTMGLTILNMHCSILPNNVWSVECLCCASSSEEERGSYSSEEGESGRDLDMFH